MRHVLRNNDWCVSDGLSFWDNFEVAQSLQNRNVFCPTLKRNLRTFPKLCSEPFVFEHALAGQHAIGWFQSSQARNEDYAALHPDWNSPYPALRRYTGLACPNS